MHVRCLSRPLFVTIFENFVSAVCHVRCLSRNFQKVMSRVRCLSRNLVSVVCHVHCLSQKFQKIMSRVRCLSWLVKNPRVNNLSRFCHRFVTFLWRLCDVYVRNSFQDCENNMRVYTFNKRQDLLVCFLAGVRRTTWCPVVPCQKLLWSFPVPGRAVPMKFCRTSCQVVPVRGRAGI